jgi:hypothetical protein
MYKVRCRVLGRVGRMTYTGPRRFAATLSTTFNDEVVMRFNRAVLVATITLNMVVAASTSAQDSTRVQTPKLLKRIAEAVDGHRTPGPKFVVASYDSLHPVAGVFSDRPSADDLRARLGPRWDVFGPFHSDVVCELRSEVRMPCLDDPIGGCVHDGWSSMMGRLMGGGTEPICPPDAGVLRGLRLSEVASMTLTFTLRDGTTRHLPISGNADAIFLTLPALDKFAFPYYARVGGPELAAMMRQNYVAAMRR